MASPAAVYGDLDLGGHGTLYVPSAQGWYAHPVRTVRGAVGASRPAPPVRTQRGRLARVARTEPGRALRRPRGVRVSLDLDQLDVEVQQC